MEEKLHPDLLKTFSVLQELNFDDLNAERKNSTKIYEELNKTLPAIVGVTTSEKFIPGPDGEPEVRVKIYEPNEKIEVLPGVIYIHGGGYIVGSADMNDRTCQELVLEIGCVIVSVDYRLAPEQPFPAPLEDCYAALKWFSENANEIGVEPNRIAVTGGSAGGGLTAALSLLARDRKGPSIAFQMPLYPMIDHRNITKSSREINDLKVWNRKFNVQAWEMYLGSNSEGEVSPYASPTLADDLTGLPPTYTCVGELDPFCDETIEYVYKLRKAGVPTEFHLYPGCYHGFEVMDPHTTISQRAINEYNGALKRALHKKQLSETII